MLLWWTTSSLATWNSCTRLDSSIGMQICLWNIFHWPLIFNKFHKHYFSCLFSLPGKLLKLAAKVLSTFPLYILSLTLKNFCFYSIEMVCIEVPTDWHLAQVNDNLSLHLTGSLSRLWPTEEFFFGWTLLLQTIVMRDLSNCSITWSSLLISLFYWLILFTRPLNTEEALLFFFDTFTLAYESKYHPSTDDP